jgi:undecaprenyl-diphosphatase
MDKTLMFLINRVWTNPFLDRLMAVLTDFAVWLPILVLVLVLVLWRGGFRARSFAVTTLICLAFTDGIVTQFGKQLINRPRPSQSLADVRQVSLEKTHPAILGVLQPVRIETSPAPYGEVVGRSFPSGHAMNNAVIATMLIVFFGRWGTWYVLPAALVAYSRIYCGSHWPSDILVSVVLAVGFALLAASLLSSAYRAVASRWLRGVYHKHPSLIPLRPS